MTVLRLPVANPAFNAEEARTFIQTAYPTSVTGQLSVSTIDRSGKCVSRQFARSDLEQLIAYVAQLDSTSIPNIYLRVTACHAVTDGRGGAKDSTDLVGLWSDLDFGAAGHNYDPNKYNGLILPRNEHEAAEIVTTAKLPAPTLWVHSGGGLYAWWLLDGQLVINESNRDAIENISVRWHRVLAQAAQAMGFHYGPGVHDLARILRLPGSVNRKVIGRERPCYVIASHGPRYDIAALASALSASEQMLGLVAQSATPHRNKQDKHDSDNFFFPEWRPVAPGAGSPLDDFETRTDWAEILCPVGWSEDGNFFSRTGERRWTRPGKDEGVSATTGREADRDRLFCFSDNAGLPTWKALTKPAVLSLIYYGGDVAAAAADLYSRGYGARQPPVSIKPNGLNLPEEFWSSRAALKHIRDAAHMRSTSADAVLGAVLARLSSLLPGDLRVDTGVRMPASLNYYSIILGGPSTGKSTAANIAEMLFPFGYDCDSRRYKVGSGQGIAAAYGSVIEGEFKQSSTKALFFAHEGSTLLKLARQRENTTLDTLREAWTGDEIGQKNAASERDRRVHGYALGFWAGMQPVHAIELFSDINIGDGTLQRFVWFSATDPAIPRTKGRRPLPAAMPVDLSVVWGQETITLPSHLEEEIRERDAACGRGEVQVDPGQEHATLRQVKTACLLAILDNRRAVNDEDWTLAGAVLAGSDAVAQSVRDGAAERARAIEERKTAARHRALDADEARVDQKVEKLAVRALEKIKEKPGIARGALRCGLSRQREAAEAAIELLIATDLVREEAVQQGSRLFPILP